MEDNTRYIEDLSPWFIYLLLNAEKWWSKIGHEVKSVDQVGECYQITHVPLPWSGPTLGHVLHHVAAVKEHVSLNCSSCGKSEKRGFDGKPGFLCILNIGLGPELLSYAAENLQKLHHP